MFIPDLSHIRKRTRGYLPHWERDGATYFVTYRLADSLPKHVAESLAADRSFRRIDAALDAGHGDAHLRNPRIASLVVDNWAYFDRERYELIAWCVMPNHVHVVLRPTIALAKVVHSWKTYTARRANAILGRSGPFWCREYFDRLVRSEEELDRIVAYVVGNPTAAGLRDWSWVWSEGGRPASGQRDGG